MDVYAVLEVRGRVLSVADLAAVTIEAGVLLERAVNDRERGGRLRLRALGSAGQADPGAELRFVGD